MDINVKRSSPLIKVLADQAQNKSVETDKVEEANEIISELLNEPNKNNLEIIANTVAYTVTDLQQHELDFMNQIADQKTIGWNEEAAFKVKNNNGLRAVFQARGATTPRSYVGEKQITVTTEELSIRPAINIMDLRTGRVNMSDLIREANREMTLAKIAKVEQVLHGSIGGGKYQTPFYGTGTGINKQVLDSQIQYFRGIAPVTLLGDIAAVGLLANVPGMQMSNNMLDEYNNNGFLGRYIGCSVLTLQNAYRDGEIKPILADNWIYIIPAGMSADSKNLKIVNQGGVEAFEATDINSKTYEMRLDQNFGVAFVTAHNPTMGAYCIN